MKPGITCYWQTRRNRDTITFNEWVDIDLWLLSARADAPEGKRPSMARCSAFEFDDVSAAEPTEFELYYRAGEHEYCCILSVHADEIVSEGLWRRKLGASRTATLFEREGVEVRLGPTLRKLATAATLLMPI